MAGNLKTVSSLSRSTDPTDLVAHHREVVSYHGPRKTLMARCYDAARGRIWTTSEHADATVRNKSLLGVNILKPKERTILGLFVQNRYDMRFVPRQPDEQGMAQVFEQLRIYDSYVQEDERLDIELLRRAWAGGTAYQECWMDTAPGRESRMRTANVSSFAVYWDPDSVDIGARTDARFVDIDSFMAPEDLVAAFPDKEGRILAAPSSESGSSVSSYERTPGSSRVADRDHESRDSRNGKYRVVERYYRVNSKVARVYSDEGLRLEMPEGVDPRGWASAHGAQLVEDQVEELWYAAACPALLRDEYLYNAPHSCQPRDADTGRILWPVLELAAESLEGDATGFVEQELDVVRAISASLTNMVTSSKHAASQAQLVDDTAFRDAKEAEKFKRHHSDADMSFSVKAGRVGDAAAPVRHGSVSAEVAQSMEYSKKFSDEIGSTPPPLMGMNQKTVSGVLNAQFIEQAVLQLMPFIRNYKDYLKRRAMLRFAYWQQYYTYPMTFRVLDKEAQKSLGEYLSVNEPQPEIDRWGNYTGNVVLGNGIRREVPYDILVEEGTKTATYRMRVQQQLSEMMSSPVTQMDPVLAAFMLMEYMRLSDVSPELKERMAQHSSVLAQHNEQKLAMESEAQSQKLAASQAQASLAQEFSALDAAQKQLALEKGELENRRTAQEIAERMNDGVLPPEFAVGAASSTGAAKPRKPVGYSVAR